MKTLAHAIYLIIPAALLAVGIFFSIKNRNNGSSEVPGDPDYYDEDNSSLYV